MRKFTYYYGLIATTIVLFGSLFVPAPFKYLQMLALAPFTLLAWVNFTNPHKVSEAKWSMRIIIISALLIPLGAGAFYLSMQPPEPERDVLGTQKSEKSEELIASMSAEITKLREELKESTSKENESKRLTGLMNLIEQESTPTPMPKLTVGSVKVISTTEVDVYEEQSASSIVVGIASPNQVYPYSQKDENWYLVTLGYSEDSEELIGWIEKAAVRELAQ